MLPVEKKGISYVSLSAPMLRQPATAYACSGLLPAHSVLPKRKRLSRCRGAAQTRATL